jgi:photosystem II stability/assembly factor-like uncharacterized protein
MLFIFFEEAGMFFVKRFGVLAIAFYLSITIQAFAQSWTEMKSPEGIYCYDILSFSEQDIYIVGYQGAIMHYDGSDWQKMDTPNRMPLWGIWGTDSNNIYAVGGNGVILYYDGVHWSTMNSGTRQWLYDIWGTDLNTIYAVGAGVILKYDGSNWTHMMIGDEYKTFFTIYGNHENDVYAAGDFKRIYHYNGVGWTEIKAVDSDQIWGIFTSGTHIFAAGTLINGHSVVYHYNGLKWTDTQLSVNSDLWGLWGSSENDVYCVGDSGTIVSYDGHNWNEHSVDENIRLRGIHGQLGTAYILSETGAILKKEANYHIQLGHVSGHAGETMRIPISLTNTRMIQMEGIDIAIDYDPDIFSVQSASLTGGILSDENYTLETKLSQPGRAILVFGATNQCVVESGIVAYLVCHVLDDIGRTGNFTENQWNQPQSILISKAEINENVASVHSGSVTVMNYPPIISDFENIEVAEDQGPFDILFTVHDTETSVDSLTITVEHTGSESFFSEPVTISGSHAQRALHLVPAQDAFGQIEISVIVFDGIHQTQKTIVCTVLAENDPPEFVKGPNITIYEDENRQHIQNWASNITPGPSNESDQSISFITKTLSTELFDEFPQVLPDGTLSFKPKSHAYGIAEIEISLKDSNNGISSKQYFVINIIPVNDPPSFTPGKNIIVMEDSEPHLITQWAKNIISGDLFELDQDVSFTVKTENPVLFTELPKINPDGDLMFSISPNKNGETEIWIQIEDNGGNDNGGVNMSKSYSSVITVVSVNDPPSFIKGSDISVFKNSDFQAYENWATHIIAGPEDEKDQPIHFILTNDANHLFDIQPGITNEGTLSFKPKSDITGEALVDVYIVDDPINQPPKMSNIQQFMISIMDYPSISGKVSYFSNEQPVRNVTLILDGNNDYQTQTNEKGEYLFTDVLPGTYLLTADKSDDLQGLSGSDASSIFRHASESYTLNCFEMIAADVTRSGRIGGTDASRVARYRVGLTSCLNENCLEWIFTPSSTYPRMFLSEGAIIDKDQCQEWPPITFSQGMHLYQVKTSLSNMNFVAFRLGDTTGNWTPDSASEKRSAVNYSTKLIDSDFNGSVSIPLAIDEMETISGIDFSVLYDANRLIPLGVTLNNTIVDNKKYELHVNMMQTGIIKGIISATQNLVTAKGTVLYLNFQWADQNDVNVDNESVVTVREFLCNEKRVPLERFHFRRAEIKSNEEILEEKLKRFDIYMDGKKGLEEAIDALRSISEQ